MKKILFLDTSLKIAGGQKSFLQLLAALKDRKLNVFAGVPFGSLVVNDLDDIGIPWFDVPVWSASYESAKGISFHIDFIKGILKLKKIMATRDVEIVYANTFLAGLCAVIAGKLSNVPVIFYDRDLVVHAFFTRLLARSCFHIIAVSHATAEKYSQHDPEKVTIMYNSVDTSLFSPGQSTFRDQMGGNTADPVIGYAGRISSSKGIDLIPGIAELVIQQFPRARFLIVGDPFLKQDRGLPEKIKEDIYSRGLKDNFIFTGFRSDIVDVIRGFDILILPSINEPFGRVLIEAMAIGKPVIAFNSAGPSEIITNGETGFLVPAGDYEAFARTIIHLLQNEDIKRATGIKSREYVLSAFSLDQHVDKFVSVHNSLLKNLNK